MRKTLGLLAGAVGLLLTTPGLMFLFVQARGFDFSDSPGVPVALPIQLSIAGVLLVASAIMLFGGKKKS